MREWFLLITFLQHLVADAALKLKSLSIFLCSQISFVTAFENSNRGQIFRVFCSSIRYVLVSKSMAADAFFAMRAQIMNEVKTKQYDRVKQC